MAPGADTLGAGKTKCGMKLGKMMHVPGVGSKTNALGVGGERLCARLR